MSCATLYNPPLLYLILSYPVLLYSSIYLFKICFLIISSLYILFFYLIFLIFYSIYSFLLSYLIFLIFYSIYSFLFFSILFLILYPALFDTCDHFLLLCVSLFLCLIKTTSLCIIVIPLCHTINTKY